MNMKRIVSALLGMPLVILVLVIKNIYVVDIAFTIIAIICLYEFYKAFSTKHRPVNWIGYISTINIAALHFFADGSLFNSIILTIFISILLLFIEVFKKKINIIDVAITLLGICYITIFILFVPLTKEIPNGDLLIWYIFGATWGTDVFAYLIGFKFGKHKFTEISPKKSIEGCFGGIIGAIVAMLIMTYIFNTICDLNISYTIISIIAIVLSIVSQIGDLIASSIKRFVGIKDFGNLIPGHGGMLDRFDSVIFAAPIAYLLIALL